MPACIFIAIATYTYNLISYIIKISLLDDCGSLKDIQDKQPTVVKAGSAIELATPDRSACRHGNASYVLLHQNQKSGKLQRLYDQKEYRVETPPIYLNISGVYCVYKQCGAVQMDQCCIKATG